MINRTPMKYRVVLKKSNEGYAVWVPALPGCASQGATQTQALENIQAAIAEYLAVVRKLARRHKLSRIVEVPAAV
jgi:predicted RNase H-like HicB family nuclease